MISDMCAVRVAGEEAEAAAPPEEEQHVADGDDEEEAVVRVRPLRRQQEVDEDFERELAALTLTPTRVGPAAAPGVSLHSQSLRKRLV